VTTSNRRTRPRWRPNGPHTWFSWQWPGAGMDAALRNVIGASPIAGPSAELSARTLELCAKHWGA
jgi:hypothetical protein